MERSLVQILVPQVNGHGDRVPLATLQALGRELTDRFGGVTCYSRAPAEGLWQQDEDAPPKKDDIIIYEVMAQRFDAHTGARCRRGLRSTLRNARSSSARNLSKFCDLAAGWEAGNPVCYAPFTRHEQPRPNL